MPKTLRQELDEYRKTLADAREMYALDGEVTPQERGKLDELEAMIDKVLDKALGEAGGGGAKATPGKENVKQEPQEELTPEYFNLDDVEEARGAFVVSAVELTAYCAAASDFLTEADRKFSKLFDIYTDAYGDYSAAIKAGGAEADNQEMWKNIVIGTAASVAIAAVGAVALPAAVAGASLAKAPAMWAAYNVGSNAIASGGGAALGELTKIGKDGLDPARDISPETQQLRVWKRFAEVGKQVATLSKSGANTVLANDAANYAIAEVRRHLEGGRPDHTVEETVDLVTSVVDYHQAVSSLKLASATTSLKSAKTKVAGMKLKTAKEMEQDIWVLWMSSLAADSGVLDYDAIEDRLTAIGVLGPSSRLGVDFGSYTSDADEAQAIKAAKKAAGDIKKSYESLGA
ncbi:MAG: hypothetical protein ACRCT8_00210 [Lacipirellulaceae bacterium]